MNDEVKQIFDDRENNFYPSDDKAFEKIKCDLKPSNKIYWYYQEDKEFSDEEEYDIKEYPGFSGIIIPFPDVTLNSHDDTELDIEDCIVIITEYPAEKEYCRAEWLYLERLLDEKDLVEIFSKT